MHVMSRRHDAFVPSIELCAVEQGQLGKLWCYTVLHDGLDLQTRNARAVVCTGKSHIQMEGAIKATYLGAV